MTVAAKPATISYIEDGVTTVFAVPYRFKAATDLVVERIADGAVASLTLGIDYSVTGGDTDAGGTLTRTAATTGATLRITRSTARTQPMEYTTGDRFPAVSHEQALDRAMLIDQEQDVAIADQGTRSLMVPPGETAPDLNLTGGDNHFLVFADGEIKTVPIELGIAAANPVLIASRVLLAALPIPTDGQPVQLTEVGHAGPFIFRAVDLSAEVAADAAHDFYIAPAAAPTGASGAWVRDSGNGLSYVAPGNDSIPQTMGDTVRRERLNLYDKIPRSLWAGIEAGTNTADLTPYVVAALETGRGINARAGRYRMAVDINFECVGASIRGEGRAQGRTVFENLNNNAILQLDSSSANILGFQLEDLWMENRDPVAFSSCDLLKFTGAGDGEAFQNDKHNFRNLWLYLGRDNIAIYKRTIWTTFDGVSSTGALRDAVHIETDANINQLSFINRCVLKGAGRNALFIKHDSPSLATGMDLSNTSFEDSGFEAIRVTGTFGVQGFGLNGATFENNARLLAVGETGFIDGIRRRKAQIFGDAPYLVGCDINRTTFYNNTGGGSGGNPDWHIYMSAVDAVGAPVVVQSGEIRNSRFLSAQPTGGDVTWTIGLTYGANNVNSGVVLLDETRGSIDMRKFTPSDKSNAVLQLSGTTTTPQGIVRFVRQGDLVTASFPLITGTSNTTDASLSGLPAQYWPSNPQVVPAIIQDGTAGIGMGLCVIQPTGAIDLLRDVGGDPFANTGTKGIRVQTLTWSLS
ncbi:hypothetical protein [Sphingomonas sp.]|uniref:hypothetical protein n=1 Tax=Sphingomonas sp. TaxID=28214 RepID=UPI00257C6884|nr:hypothetical protein [Sphingomonas sp.]